MSILFFLIGFYLAGTAGLEGMGWYFIFISGAITSIGWFIQRAGVCSNLIKEKGLIDFVIKLIPTQLIIYSFPCAFIYFIASLFS